MAKKINDTYRLAIVSLNNQLFDHERDLEELEGKLRAARYYLAAEPTDKRVKNLREALQEYLGMKAKVEIMRKCLQKALNEVVDHLEDSDEEL